MSLIAPVKPFFKYSMDLRQPVPVVAYYCQLYGVQKGLEIVKGDTSGQDTAPLKKFLMGEMKTLEEMKKALPEGTTKDDHRYVVENFVTSAFTNADKDERTCETITKKNAKDFNTCSHFIMLLSVFGDAYDEGEWEEKRKYCVFKAGSIMKALKVGEQPPRGNPSDPNNDGQRQVPQAKQEEAKVADPGPALPDLDDMAAELARLEAGGSGTDTNASQIPSTQPPVPDMSFGLTGVDFNQMNANMNVPQAQVPTYQPALNDPGQIPQYQPQQPVMPQPVMPQPTYQPQQPVIQPQTMGGGPAQAAGGSRSMQYFMDMGDAEKHIKHCQSEIDFNNAQGATDFIKKAIGLFQKHCGPQGKGIQLAPYQPKAQNQAGTPQRMQDNQQSKKLCKYAISEVDFNNVDAAVSWLAQAYQLQAKY